MAIPVMAWVVRDKEQEMRCGGPLHPSSLACNATGDSCPPSACSGQCVWEATQNGPLYHVASALWALVHFYVYRTSPEQVGF